MPETRETAKEKPKFKFLLKLGKHQDRKGPPVEVPVAFDDEGEPTKFRQTPTLRNFKRGDTIDTTDDLRLLDPLGEKYQFISGPPMEKRRKIKGLREDAIYDPLTPGEERDRFEQEKQEERSRRRSPATEEDEEEGGDPDTGDLHSMTVAQLREYAQEEEIDLEGAARKDEIIKAIEKANKG